jgi:hypothetical protein
MVPEAMTPCPPANAGIGAHDRGGRPDTQALQRSIFEACGNRSGRAVQDLHPGEEGRKEKTDGRQGCKVTDRYMHDASSCPDDEGTTQLVPFKFILCFYYVLIF